MKCNHLIAILFSLTHLFLLSSPAVALTNDWGQFQGDAQHTGNSPFTGTDVPVLPAWTVDEPLGESSPSVGADGTIYFVSDTTLSLHAIAPNGAELWRTFLGTGSRGLPALSDTGQIYVGGENGELYALDLTGKLLWQFSTPDSGAYGNAGIFGTPAIAADGRIFFQGLDGVLFALTPQGTVIWQKNPDVFRHNGAFNYFWMTSATLDPAGSHVYIQSSDTGFFGSTQGHLFSFDAATGALEWANSLGDGLFATPTVGADGTIYAVARTSAGGFLYAINADGTEKWRFAINGQLSSTALTPDQQFLYVAGALPGSNAKYLVKLAAASGTEVWRTRLMSSGFVMINAPVISANGTVYIGTANGEFARENSVFAVSPDGVILWQYQTGAPVWSTVAIGPDGTVYTGSDKLYALVDRQLVNSPPIARIIAPATAVAGDIVPLDGSTSSDPDDDPVTYSWTLDQRPPGSQAGVAGPTVRFPSLLPDIAGDYVISLVVNDGFLDSVPDRATVSVISAQQCSLNSISVAQQLVLSAADNDFDKPKQRDALVKSLTKAAGKVQTLDRDKAIAELTDVRNRTDGCSLRGRPDTEKPEDWIINCTVANEVFDAVQRAIECAGRM